MKGKGSQVASSCGQLLDKLATTCKPHRMSFHSCDMDATISTYFHNSQRWLTNFVDVCCMRALISPLQLPLSTKLSIVCTPFICDQMDILLTHLSKFVDSWYYIGYVRIEKSILKLAWTPA